MIQLEGLTWDHARGHDPLVAAASGFRQLHPDVEIHWRKLSPHEFREPPSPRSLGACDLLVIDTRHVGLAQQQGLLLPLDEPAHSAELAALARHGVGPSHTSYQGAGRQWALAIDASAQVACYRPDRLDRTPSRWADVITMAEAGRVLWPLRPADAAASFFSLAANIGHPVDPAAEQLIEPAAGRRVLEAMRAVSRHLPPECFHQGPLETLEALALPTQQRAYCPLIFSFSNYSRPRYRPKRVAFSEMPWLGDEGPRGATLGGFGIAVSAHSAHPELAREFAYFVASEAVQKKIYVEHQGQPAHALAWSDEHANQLCTHFFRMTRRTLELSWLPPRDAGFLALSEACGEIVHAFVQGAFDEGEALCRLQQAHRAGIASRPAVVQA